MTLTGYPYMNLPKKTAVVGIFAALAMLGSSLHAQPAEVRIVVTPDSGSGMSGDPDLGLDAAVRIGSTLRYTGQFRSEAHMNAFSIGWIFYSPDNSITNGVRIENVKLDDQWNSISLFQFGPSLNTGLIDGVLPERILTGGAGGIGPPNTGGGGFQNSTFIDFIEWTVAFDSSGIFCTDSAFFPPAAQWLAVDENGASIGPLWFGGGGDAAAGGTRTESYCVNVLPEDCCATPGDANHDGRMNIADILYIRNRIFRNGPHPACCRETDANGDGRMNIADITYLIARIFAGGPAPICGGPIDNC